MGVGGVADVDVVGDVGGVEREKPPNEDLLAQVCEG